MLLNRLNWFKAALTIAIICGTLGQVGQTAELRIVCSVPDLASMVKVVGAEHVRVQTLVRPGDNPHFISARPSFVRSLARAHAFVVVGMDLEVGWAPALLRGARNRQVQPGQAGFIDASDAIAPLEVPSGELNRSQGDVHPHGNPHYLLSPLCGMQVMMYLGERLAALDPDRADTYRLNAAEAVTQLATALYGETLVQSHQVEHLASWHLAGQLHQHIDMSRMGGWMAAMRPLASSNWIDDHSQWPYLAACYGINIVGHLEPKAGVPPTSSHLKGLLDVARAHNIRGIISAPWFDPRHARLLSQRSQRPIVTLAHQVGALPQTADYIAMYQHHVNVLTSVLPTEPSEQP